MKKNFLLSIVFLLLLPAVVFAQGDFSNARGNLEDVGAKVGGTMQTDLGAAIGTAISAVLGLVGLIFFVLMVYAGYLWMTARGESEPVDKAKKIITASIIGLVIVASAYAITVLLTGTFDQSIGGQ